MAIDAGMTIATMPTTTAITMRNTSLLKSSDSNAISGFQTQIAKLIEKGQMTSAISYTYAYVSQLVEKVPPKIPMFFLDKYPFNNTTERFQEISANTEFLSKKSRPWPSMLADN